MGTCAQLFFGVILESPYAFAEAVFEKYEIVKDADDGLHEEIIEEGIEEWWDTVAPKLGITGIKSETLWHDEDHGDEPDVVLYLEGFYYAHEQFQHASRVELGQPPAEKVQALKDVLEQFCAAATEPGLHLNVVSL